MKLFENEHMSLTSEAGCAGQLMDTVPLIMRMLRREIRSRRPGDLSVPQFRVLAFLSRNGGSALSDVANHIGLMRPTISKMIETLVRRGLVKRDIADRDRRFVSLSLTDSGSSLINQARRETRSRLAELLKSLSQKDLERIAGAMDILQRVFAPDTGEL